MDESLSYSLSFIKIHSGSKFIKKKTNPAFSPYVKFSIIVFLFSQKSPGTAEESGPSRVCSPSSAQNGLPQRTQHHWGQHTHTHRCRGRKCVVHVDSLTRHSPGCQPAVSFSILGSPPLSRSIDLLLRLRQLYTMKPESL